MNIDVNQIIIKVKLLKNEKTLATAQLQYGPFVWKGFWISEGKYPNGFGNNLWIQPPSHRNKEGKFLILFFCDDIILWRKITEKIIHEYQKQKEEIVLQPNEEITEEDYKEIDKTIA